jgi:hypothetical protein
MSDNNWVQERFECSARKALQRLLKRMQQDVKIFNDKNEEAHSDERIVVDFLETAISATRNSSAAAGDDRPSVVRIDMEGDIFTIDFNGARPGHRLELTFDESGHCRFASRSEKSIDYWQVSRRALEPLMFP